MAQTRDRLSPVLLFVLLTLAAYRATRLVTMDKISDPVRTRALVKLPRSADYLVACPWCAGFYVCLVAFGLVWAFASVPLPGLWPPAMMTGVGLLGSLDAEMNG